MCSTCAPRGAGRKASSARRAHRSLRKDPVPTQWRTLYKGDSAVRSNAGTNTGVLSPDRLLEGRTAIPAAARRMCRTVDARRAPCFGDRLCAFGRAPRAVRVRACPRRKTRPQRPRRRAEPPHSRCNARSLRFGCRRLHGSKIVREHAPTQNE